MKVATGEELLEFVKNTRCALHGELATGLGRVRGGQGLGLLCDRDGHATEMGIRVRNKVATAEKIADMLRRSDYTAIVLHSGEGTCLFQKGSIVVMGVPRSHEKSCEVVYF